MPTVILVRHGRTTANASGLLAGRTPGVQLDETGQAQVAATGERIAAVPLAAAFTSPQERCVATAEAITSSQSPDGGHNSPAVVEERLAECDYGDWQGRSIQELAAEPLWGTVQVHPSAVTFPGGESMRTMQERAVAAVRERDAQVGAESGDSAVWLAVSHGDVIKAVLADALGMHLDLFQRINVDPASVSVIRYTAERPYVLAMNTHAGDLSWLASGPATPTDAEPDDGTGADTAQGGAVIGGGAGPDVRPATA